MTAPEVVALDVHDREAWLKWRMAGVGASDVAGILSRSSFASPWSVWATKVGLVPLQARDPDEPSYVRFGRDVEPVVRQWFAEDTGLFVVGIQTVVRHPGTVFFATLDGVVVEGNPHRGHGLPPGERSDIDDALGIFEAKWTGDAPWENLPERYWLQAQWGMFCSGLARAWVAAIFAPFGRPGPLRVWEVERDDDALDDIVARVATFWVDHVETGEPPPVDGSTATSRAIEAAYPAERAFGPVLDLDAERETIDDLVLLKAQEKELKASIKLLENRLKAALKDYTEGHLDGALVASWRPQTRAAYAVAESTFRTLRLHGKRSA